jgi:NAD(P)-dependent dehydrogenase (short-subunit alcohol dehydrogenase family)
MKNKVAFVTGASRGIGKAVAIALARIGYSVAVTARTVNGGEQREHSSTIASTDTTPLPGSLSETAALIREEGQDALPVPADLLDEASLGAAVATVLERWGRIDLVVHNGRYIGPGHIDRCLIIPSMIEHGGGVIANITSASGYGDPTKPAGEGGWGMGYGISKGAFQRIAGFLAVELQEQNVRCFNIQPGLIATERIGQDMAKFGIANVGAPPEVVAEVVNWLVTDPGASAFNGRTIEAQWFCHEHKLLEGWDGPTPTGNNIRYDDAAGNLSALEAQWGSAD